MPSFFEELATSKGFWLGTLMCLCAIAFRYLPWTWVLLFFGTAQCVGTVVRVKYLHDTRPVTGEVAFIDDLDQEFIALERAIDQREQATQRQANADAAVARQRACRHTWGEPCFLSMNESWNHRCNTCGAQEAFAPSEAFMHAQGIELIRRVSEAQRAHVVSATSVSQMVSVRFSDGHVEVRPQPEPGMTLRSDGTWSYHDAVKSVPRGYTIGTLPSDYYGRWT